MYAFFSVHPRLKAASVERCCALGVNFMLARAFKAWLYGFDIVRTKSLYRGMGGGAQMGAHTQMGFLCLARNDAHEQSHATTHA